MAGGLMIERIRAEVQEIAEVLSRRSGRPVRRLLRAHRAA
jgi:hypothetical protein